MKLDGSVEAYRNVLSPSATSRPKLLVQRPSRPFGRISSTEFVNYMRVGHTQRARLIPTSFQAVLIKEQTLFNRGSSPECKRAWRKGERNRAKSRKRKEQSKRSKETLKFRGEQGHWRKCRACWRISLFYKVFPEQCNGIFL